MNDWVLDPILPLPLVALLALGLAGVTIRLYGRIGSSLEVGRRSVLMGFRLAGLILVLLLLLQPSRRETFPPPVQNCVTLVGVDSSWSMKQSDVERASRWEAAKNLLQTAGIVDRNGRVENARRRLFEFGPDAAPVVRPLLELSPKGSTTRLHKSVTTMLNTLSAGESARALILLTDGHDFELVNPVKTGASALARQVPIYAVPLGKQGKVRDVAVRITGFQPYCYVKQTSRITVALRLIGCEYEDLGVQLLRQGRLVQTKRLNADERQELPVEFEAIEPEIGQYEYEVRVLPLENEVDPANNSAITYLNVIDQQIRVLMVEGDPYWDTTFLRRSLLRNDKFEVDALVRFGQNRVRALRKTETSTPLSAPESLDEWAFYDLVILGRRVDEVLTAAQIATLHAYVKDRSGTVIFGRGRAFAQPGFVSDLEPVIWSDATRDKVRLGLTAEGRSLSALRALNDQPGGWESLPELIVGRTALETKPLASALATAVDVSKSTNAPAIVHRRYGQGQVISVGVEGLWRWGLNAKTEGVNTPFDRFWDQLAIWLLAGRDFIPNRQFSFRPSSANILLGEKVTFRLRMRQPDPRVTTVPLKLYFGDTELGGVNMTAPTTDPDRLTGEFLPERVGRYRAVARFPDGTTQESRFIVYTENLEETEVATDVVGLRRLCDSSGGRLLEPGEVSRLLTELEQDKSEAEPKIRVVPVWNKAAVFYLAGLLFGLDWFWRRRWGLW